MRILVISHMFPKAGSYSGIFVEQQVEELVRLGHEVTVVSPTAWAPFPLPYLSSKWKKYASVPRSEKRDGYMVFFPKYVMFPRNFAAHTSGERVWRSWHQQVEFSGGEFDLIHAHVALPDGYVAMKLAEKWKIPYVVTVHGSDFSTTINLSTRCYDVVNQVLSDAARVILVSNKLDRIRLERFPQLPEKFVVLPNGVSSKFLGPALKERKMHLGNESWDDEASRTVRREPVRILSVSNLIALKGLDDNLRALAEVEKSFTDYTYDIIGQGSERERLEKLAEELGLQAKVNFLGAKSADEVKEHMDKCDVFSLPSWNEAFGVVYLEAMACGKPVIGCEGQGIADVVAHGETGFLVPPREVGSLADTLLLLLENPDLRAKVGKQARGLVEDSYTWEKNARRTARVYEEALRR